MREFDAAKFRELFLYIAESCAEDPRFGAVKLNKILYYADFEAYRRLGEPITGDTYRKLSEGPAPGWLLQQRSILLDSGAARWSITPTSPEPSIAWWRSARRAGSCLSRQS